MQSKAVLCILLSVGLLPGVVESRVRRGGAAQERAAEATPSEASVSERRFQLFPTGTLYPRYLADPDAPVNGVVLQSFSSTSIPQASTLRQHVKIGGIFPLARWNPRRPGGRRWQLRLDGGLDAQFDTRNKTDNTGWDGNYGLMLSTDRGGGEGWSFRLGTFHISAHIGDEWIERTGIERMNYRREEFLTGAAWSWGSGRRAYLEGGWAYEVLNASLQEPARARVGFEYEGSRPVWKDYIRWYLAVDLSAWEERDWRLDTGVQAGFVARPHGRAWRLGVQYWDGRVPLGEFFALTEVHLGLGLWTDL